jgi:cytochrome c oxidase assembly protein subunit 11
VIGASWAAVPLYRAFCAHTGYGGTTQTDKDGSKLASLKPGKKEVTVSFNADVNPAMHWSFTPSQKQLKVRLGEPVLAFYKATNLRDKAVTGVATYNVTPQKSGAYFSKIQCFCFDEQRLRANETVDMPVFFYIDPAVSETRIDA